MKSYFKWMGVWEVVSGTREKPTEENSTREELNRWNYDELTARNILINIVDSDRLQMLTSCEEIPEMWKILEEKYEQNSMSNKMMLDEELQALRQEGKSLDAYMKELTHILDKMRGINQEVKDEQKVLAFLRGLNKDYSILVEILKHTPGITFETAKTSAIMHQLTHKLETATLEDAEAFSAGGYQGRGRGRSYRGRGRGNPGRSPGRSTEGRGRGRSTNLMCYTCNKPGHMSKNCPDLQREGRTCHVCGKRGHLSYDCTSRQSGSGETFCAQGVIGEAHNTVKASTWIIDSGSSHHICNQKDSFSEFKGNPQVSAVVIGNNSKLQVENEGKVKLTLNVGKTQTFGTIDAVQYVPEMGKNLFSVTQTMKQGKSVLFDAQTMSCKILKGDLQVGSATLRGGLWVLDCDEPQQASANVAEKEENMELWHQRLGHVGEDALKTMQKTQMVKGLEKDLQGTVKGACQGCKEGKQHREPFPAEEEEIIREKLELVQSDIKGPLSPDCHGGYKYFITFIDVATRRHWVYLLTHKSEAFETFKFWKAEVERQSGMKVKAFRSDQGGEYSSKEFKSHLRQCGINQQFTIARTPEQNGRAERLNRTLMENCRAMMCGAGIDKVFWGEGILTAAYLKNRTVHSSLKGPATPEERWSGHKPSVRHLRIFGSKVGVLVPKQYRGAADSKSWSGIMVGYSPSHKGWRIWNPKTRKVRVERDVIFHEQEIIAKNKVENIDITMAEKVSAPSERATDEEPRGADSESGITAEWNAYTNSLTLRDAPEAERAHEISPVALVPERQAQRHRSQPVRLTATRLGHLNVAEGQKKKEDTEENLAMAYLALGDEPVTYKEAVTGKNAKEWSAAIEKEIKSLEDNKTWEVCEKPDNKTLVGCKWVFKLKSPQEEGGEIRFKARVVAKGYSQKQGIDYHETFAPVIKYQSLRMLLAVATQEDWHIHQMDVETAFLNGDLDEEIWMEMPEGYKQEEGKQRMALRLKKSLYGLKQSPRCWNAKIHDFLTQEGFSRMATDSAVYTRGTAGWQVVLGIYVDDLLIMGKNLEAVKAIKGKLSSRFKMVDFGEVSKILGINIRRNKVSGTLTLSQEEYVDGILCKFGMEDCGSSATPLATSTKLSEDMSPKTEQERERMSGVPYRAAIGSLMYLMVSTRPDLAAAVGLLSRFLNNPGEEHWMAVKKIFKYLQGTRKMGLTYCRKEEVKLEAYTDSDWAGDVDSRKSTSAYVMMIGGAAVSWKSKRQESVALSSTEAEYMASTQACKEVIWGKDFLFELGFKQGTTQMYTDNQSSIRVMRNPVGHGRMKHIELQAYFVRDLIERGDVDFSYCSTDVQVADSLTKAVPREKVESCNRWMGLQLID